MWRHLGGEVLLRPCAGRERRGGGTGGEDVRMTNKNEGKCEGKRTFVGSAVRTQRRKMVVIKGGFALHSSPMRRQKSNRGVARKGEKIKRGKNAERSFRKQ